MRRRLFNLAAAISLVLCATTGAMWGRSYAAQDQITIRLGPSPTSIHVFHAHGSVASTVTRSVIYDVPAWRAKVTSSDEPVKLYEYWHSRSPIVHAGGFSVVGPQSVGEGGGVLVPHWFLLLATAALPALAARRVWGRRRARRAGEQPCPTCGYDLRASPDYCPECGAIVE
jgi:hypothetical protein